MLEHASGRGAAIVPIRPVPANSPRPPAGAGPVGTAIEAVAQPDDGPYRRLLGEIGWRRLPAVVRKRFGRTLIHDETRAFRGEVVETTMSRVGWLLAQLARSVGAPLPVRANAKGPAHVVVAEDEELGAQVWTRIYTRHGTFPQVINSAKRFAGPTGLEECLGRGLLMRLNLLVEDGALIFRSAGFAIEVLGRQIALPAWIGPGRCDVIHRDIGHGYFTFTLELHHPWFGLMIRQVAVFEEV